MSGLREMNGTDLATLAVLAHVEHADAFSEDILCPHEKEKTNAQESFFVLRRRIETARREVGIQPAKGSIAAYARPVCFFNHAHSPGYTHNINASLLL
jgi:hypothetical protein